MEFTVKYRNKEGRAEYVVINANSRSEVFPILKQKGIAPIHITEGSNIKPTPSDRRFLFSFKTVAIGVALLGVLGLLLTYFLINADSEISPKEIKPAAIKQTQSPKVPVKKNVVRPVTNLATKAAAQSKAEKTDLNVRLNLIAVTNASGEVMERWTTQDGKTHARLIPPKPIFDNVIDQTLSIALSVPNGHSLPPMPALGPNANKEFAKALKKPIVINDDDPEDVKRAKLLVQAGREAILDQLDSGKSVNEIIADHCAAVNDNAELRKTVNSEYRKLLEEGDLEGAETYREEANKILEKAGAEPVPQRSENSRTRLQKKGSDK